MTTSRRALTSLSTQVILQLNLLDAVHQFMRTQLGCLCVSTAKVNFMMQRQLAGKWLHYAQMDALLRVAVQWRLAGARPKHLLPA